MAKARDIKSGAPNIGANLVFEAKLWLATDKLRDNMCTAEYKYVVLTLIFLKYISDTDIARKTMQYCQRNESQWNI